MFPFNQPIEEVLLGSNIYMPLSHVVARTSPLNLQVGRAGKDVEGTLDLSNFHGSKGWDEFNPSDSHFRDMVRSPVAGQIDPGYFVAALLRCCFGVLHVGMLMGSKKNMEISVWSSVENRKVYESRDVWCLIIHFLGVYTQTSNGPMVPNSYPCPSVSGILVNIHTTAADVASFVSQPVCNLPSPWQLEEIWYCPM